jgi:FkbM family methyltransferase
MKVIAMSFNKSRGPSITGFLNSLYKRFLFIKLYSKYGDHLKDKLNIVMILLLDIIPRRLRKGFLKKLIVKIKNVLISKIIMQVNGVKYFLLDRESILIVSPEHEKWIGNYLKPKKDEVFIDVGAHIGKYALQVAKIVGEKGLVIAIEASPINYNVLLKNCRLNNIRNVIALNIAAWKSNGELKLFIGDVGGHHSVKLNFGLGFIKVSAKALDNVLKELYINRVDWIKIDVEGAEYEVLEGLKSTIQQYKPTLIIEVLKENLEKVTKFMNESNYIVKLIPENPPYLYCKPIKQS